MSKRNLTEQEKKELTIIGDLFREAVYSHNSLPSILEAFADSLENAEGSIEQIILSEVLMYKQLIQNRELFAILRDWIDELYQILATVLPDHVSFTIECRRKSAQSTIIKILNDYFDETSINLFDLVAFRIVIDSLESTEEQIKHCYTVADICMKFFQQKRCTLCAPSKKVGKSNLMKDYIQSPKSNGYMSIHLAFKTLGKDVVECQIRTLDMHERAEIGNADHGHYKNSEYKSVSPYLELDPTRVKIPNFRVLSNGSIYDQVGLIHALHIEKRSKTF